MKTPSFKTPVEKIFFRSSKIGLLAGGLIRHGLTINMKEEKEKLELLKITPIGLTDKQSIDFEVWNDIVSKGGELSAAKLKKREEYKKKLTTPKGLTDTQTKRLEDLIYRETRPPELSEVAKTFVKEVWLQNEKGFREEIDSKYLKKGLQAEEDALSLISYVDGVMYVKNEKKEYKGHISGECDSLYYFKEANLRVVDDTKCNWDPKTFMSAFLTTLYEWQGRSYIHLYNADIFRLRDCLVNCPPDVFSEEYKRFCFKNNIIDDTSEEYKPLLVQFFRNYIYDFDIFNRNKRFYPDTFLNYAEELEPLYTKEERVKTFPIERDFELEEVLLKSVELAVEYYQTITLNMKEE